ncbi:MAG: AbrB/MazE/SpoVT family DNA-binding domain-containing protein [Gammaproteobacteria bacterium]|nr:AbrB/MazE/SpoVT family DNA-binding domain-containing protein [Gammaproteobacteria bacterium]
MNAKVRKWGNSLALRIPKAAAEDAHIQRGMVVDLSIRNGKAVIDPSPEPSYTLEQLLKGVTKKNIHAEADTGPLVGREQW